MYADDWESRPIGCHCIGTTDERLANDIEHAFYATGYPSLWKIEVTSYDRGVTLRGQLPSYYLKQLAQSIAMDVEGVDSLTNNIEVI